MRLARSRKRLPATPLAIDHLDPTAHAIGKHRLHGEIAEHRLLPPWYREEMSENEASQYEEAHAITAAVVRPLKSS